MADKPDPTDPFDSAEDRPTVTPFLGALVIIFGVVMAIGLFTIFDRDPATPEQQITGATIAQNDALQRQSYPDFRTFTCAAEQKTESEIIDRQQNSVDRRGERYLDDVTDIAISGDRATARVTYHFDHAPDNEVVVEMAFVDEDGTWKVCSPGPS